MSVQSEINRLATAKTAIGTAIAGKGVAVPSGTKLDGMAALIDGIESGGEDVSAETAEYTELLTDLETAIDALTDAGSGGSGGAAVETCTVTIKHYPSYSMNFAVTRVFYHTLNADGEIIPTTLVQADIDYSVSSFTITDVVKPTFMIIYISNPTNTVLTNATVEWTLNTSYVVRLGDTGDYILEFQPVG